MIKNLFVSPSPHVHSGDSISKNMYGVLIALVPAVLISFYNFGLGAVVVMLTSMVACVGFEYLIQRFLLKVEPSVNDGSALLTGILLAMNLPSNLPIWIIIIGSLVAIGIGKMSFGGLGNNPFNPALVGRVFMLISFPVQMTSWPRAGASWTSYLDAATGATPLSIIKEGLMRGDDYKSLITELPSITDMFMGFTGGSFGEVGAFALMLGLIFMLIRKIITWHIPVSILVTAGLFSSILFYSGVPCVGATIQLLSGGLMLGAIFMATDYVTSPMSKPGMIIYGVGIGLLTIIIRVFGAYPEGISFAILIMNGFTPIINKYVQPKRFGEQKK